MEENCCGAMPECFFLGRLVKTAGVKPALIATRNLAADHHSFFKVSDYLYSHTTFPPLGWYC